MTRPPRLVAALAATVAAVTFALAGCSDDGAGTNGGSGSGSGSGSGPGSGSGS